MQHDAAVAERFAVIDRCGELLVAREVAAASEDDVLTDYYKSAFDTLKHTDKALSLHAPRDLEFQGWAVGASGSFRATCFLWPNGRGVGRIAWQATFTLGGYTQDTNPVSEISDYTWRAADTIAVTTNSMNANPTNVADQIALLTLDAYGLPHLCVQIENFTTATRGLVAVRVV